MPDIPAPIALPIAGALVLTIGILWKRLVSKEDEHTEAILSLTERYHRVITKILGQLDLEEENGD